MNVDIKFHIDTDDLYNDIESLYRIIISKNYLSDFSRT